METEKHGINLSLKAEGCMLFLCQVGREKSL
jgi:hypothetical protein